MWYIYIYIYIITCRERERDKIYIYIYTYIYTHVYGYHDVCTYKYTYWIKMCVHSNRPKAMEPAEPNGKVSQATGLWRFLRKIIGKTWENHVFPWEKIGFAQCFWICWEKRGKLGGRLKRSSPSGRVSEPVIDGVPFGYKPFSRLVFWTNQKGNQVFDWKRVRQIVNSWFSNSQVDN